MDREKASEADTGGKCACELEVNLDILRKVPIFSSIPIERLKLYAYLSKRMRYRPGNLCFATGKAATSGTSSSVEGPQVIRELKPIPSFCMNIRRAISLAALPFSPMLHGFSR